MSFQLRAVSLRANTARGAWGRLIRFGPGLNVLRGSNSRGKTQVVQAVIYALGLERMLQARANAPLGSAMTSELSVANDEESGTVRVLTSWVAVELSNESGQIFTVQRHVRHNRIENDLVRVWDGPALTGPVAARGAPVEMFLNRAGSASRDLGFHKLLADIIGWTLPQVSTYAGTTSTLYLDVLFPFLIVDQQSWGSAAPRKVDRYQIREPLRRATEFLLGLSGPVAEARRAELDQTISSLRTQWAAARASLGALSQAVGGQVVNVPEHASGAQARAANPETTELSSARLEVLQAGEWIPVTEVVASLSEELARLEHAGTRSISPDIDREVVEQLQLARAELGDLMSAARLIENDLSLEEAQLSALDRRRAALIEERDRNADIRTLSRLGGEVSSMHLADHNCPTCRQSLDPVESEGLGPVLPVEETVSLLGAQISTTQKMRDRSQQGVAQAASAYAAMQRQADQVRATIRALEEDLLAPTNSPSAGDIARRVTVQLRRDELQRANMTLVERIDEMQELANEIADTRRQLNALPVGVPDSDAAQLLQLTDSMRRKLRATRFGSYDVGEVSLDQDSLRPTRAGFDLDTDVSASDVVRIKVAYLEALREQGQVQGHHPGLLILDEPRQQDIDPTDFASMLKYLAVGSSVAGQVIVTSATPRSELDRLLVALEVMITDLGDERLLQPVEGDDEMDVV